MRCASVARESGNTQPQVVFRDDPHLVAQAKAIAKARNERDLTGRGLSVVLRAALRAYVRKHRDQIPPELADD